MRFSVLESALHYVLRYLLEKGVFYAAQYINIYLTCRYFEFVLSKRGGTWDLFAYVRHSFIN